MFITPVLAPLMYELMYLYGMCALQLLSLEEKASLYHQWTKSSRLDDAKVSYLVQLIYNNKKYLIEYTPQFIHWYWCIFIITFNTF